MSKVEIEAKIEFQKKLVRLTLEVISQSNSRVSNTKQAQLPT